MALISPILDDRSYAQLREELLRRIPVYTPDWTDHNETDPGIALLDLFAYLGESVLYRFNQIPETTRIEFLRLLGVRPRPARAATVLLTATTDTPSGVQIPAGTGIAAGALPFRTTGETYAWPLECVALGKVPAPPSDGTRSEEDRRADASARVGLPDASTAAFYVTSQLATDPDGPGAEPLDVRTTLDGALWIAVLRTDRTDLSALAGRSLFVAVAFDEQVERPFALERLDAVGARTYGSPALTADPPPMLWRLWNGPDAGFTTLTVGDDTTRGLVTSGVVELLLPQVLPRLDPAAPSPGDAENPPPLPDAAQAARVVAWLQVVRPKGGSDGTGDDGNDTIRRVHWVGLNGVLALQARDATPELLGSGTGDSGQRCPLAHHPVLAGTTVLEVEEPDGWRPWTETDTFVAAGPEDRYYTVDHGAGAVEFAGPRVPQLGERIRVVTYQYGGGAAGNVPAGAVTSVVGVSGVKVTNPLPAAGGADAARLDEALDAIPGEVHRRDRAVTVDDFGALALEVPGVARAQALPLLHPDTPGVDAAGVVSVVVFPAEDLASPDSPLPDLGLLRRVATYLDERRLVTTELYAIPPTYRPAAVSVGLAVRAGYQVDAVRRWVEQLLRQYLAPLPPDGPDGGGWPLGRTVRRAELEAVAVQVEGVEYATGLLLAEPGAGGGWNPVAEIVLERWQVPQLAALTVVAGPPLQPGEDYAPAGPTKVLVPLPPDVC